MQAAICTWETPTQTARTFRKYWYAPVRPSTFRGLWRGTRTLSKGFFMPARQAASSE